MLVIYNHMFVKLFRKKYEAPPPIETRDSDYGEILIDIQCFDPCVIIENYIQ
jgi:hypothetical protein